MLSSSGTQVSCGSQKNVPSASRPRPFSRSVSPSGNSSADSIAPHCQSGSDMGPAIVDSTLTQRFQSLAPSSQVEPGPSSIVLLKLDSPRPSSIVLTGAVQRLVVIPHRIPWQPHPSFQQRIREGSIVLSEPGEGYG